MILKHRERSQVVVLMGLIFLQIYLQFLERGQFPISIVELFSIEKHN